MNGLFEKIGIGNVITWLMVLGAFFANYKVLTWEFRYHVNQTRLHLSEKQIYWLHKIEEEGGFTWKPEEKAQFLSRINTHIDEFEKGVAEGRWEHPAQKVERIRKIAKSVAEEVVRARK